MKKLLLVNLALLFAATPLLLSQTSVLAPPSIPEEARRHFVIGSTLFKDAKTTDDYVQVESEFKQAADLAPQWPDARYNLALAKEAAGDFAGAMADLKLYLQFQLPDAEARKAQDKIYVLEAKAAVAAKKQAEERKVAAAEEQTKRDYQDKIGFLAGKWNLSATSDYNDWEDTVLITVTDKNVVMTRAGSNVVIKGTAADDYSSITWMLTAEGLPDLPVEVTVNKYGHSISWKEPYIRHGRGGAVSWDSVVSEMKLTK